VLWRGGSDARYVPTGHIIYALGNALFALPFNLNRVEVTGGPVPVLEGALRPPQPAQQTGTAHYDLSATGTLVHATGAPGLVPNRTLVWVDRTGREEALGAPPRSYLAPRISPDGLQVALDLRDQENDVWIWSVARQTLTRLTFDPGLDRYPVWTPDGRRIVFSSQRGPPDSLFWQAADGTGEAERLTESPSIQYPSSVSADGATVILEQQGGSVDVVAMSLSAPRRMTPLIATTTFVERNGDLSGDGQWIAYQSNESGQFEVYVRPFPGVDSGRWQISTGGGAQPKWSANSRELFYVDLEGRIVGVPIKLGAGFAAGNPQVVIDGPYAAFPGFAGRMYDVSRDGQRFLVLKGTDNADDDPPPPQIIVVQNWFEELKRVAPTT
jgi:serine/threonine-protein kinase